MKYAYYPGCTQESTAEEFGLSSEAVCHALGIELEEIPDWSCCGASSGHFVDEDLAHALPARAFERPCPTTPRWAAAGPGQADRRG